MEVLIRKISEYQDSLEDTLRMESILEEINESKDGKKPLRWLKRRRRVVKGVVKALSKF